MRSDHPTGVEARPSATLAATQQHLYDFLHDLRSQGLAVPVAKQLDFFAGVARLAPVTTAQLYWVAAATLLTSQTARPAFDEVFQQFFGSLSEVVVTDAAPEDEDEEALPERPDRGDATDDELTAVPSEAGDGLAASRTSGAALVGVPRTDLASRDFLRWIGAELPRQVPTVRARRQVTGRRRDRVDLRATCLDARRTHGEIVRLRWRHRPDRQRRLVLLIDVSRSMRDQSVEYLRFAHAAVQSCDRVEVFTFGTHLTRVTDALRRPDVDTALSAMTDVILDADGGTQIGESLVEFLANTRYQTMTRGAVVIFMSDGLERGDCEPLRHSVHAIRLLAARLVWWSPLACDERYEPLTRGMSLIRPDLDALIGVQDLATALRGVRAGFHQRAGA